MSLRERFATIERNDVHGVLLCLFAALIPVGEGAAYIALGGVTLMCLIDFRRAARALRDRPTTLTMLTALAVWFACGLAAIVFSGHGWLRPAELGRWPPLLAMFVVVASAALVGEVWLKRALGAFTAMLLVSCAFGLVQYGFNVRPGEFLTRSDLSTGQALVPGEQRSVAGGFYFHRLKMGHVLLVGLAVACGRVFFADLSKRRWLIEAGIAAVFAVTMLLTYTRGAVLGGAVACLACLPFLRGKLRWTALGVLVIGVVLGASLPGVRSRLMSSSSEEASAVRGLVWSQGVRIIADHPLGVGLGNYSALVGRYYDTVRPEFTVRTYPHSMVLAAWAETGPLGLFAYLWVWASFGVLCAKALGSAQASVRRAAAGCGLFIAVSLGVVGLTHDLLYHNAVALAFAAAVGAVLAFIDDPVARGPRLA
jgi:hypothetical protein